MAAKKKPKPLAKGRRMNIRISDSDYRKLCELRIALYLDSDSHAVRRMIGWTYETKAKAVALQAKAPGYRARVKELMGDGSDGTRQG